MADDEQIARAGIHHMLDQAGDMEIVGEAENGFEAQKMVAKLLPRILLLDFKMRGPRPAEIEEWIRKNYPQTITLILTAHDQDAYLSEVINSGIAGYVNKSVEINQLIDAIRRAANGEILFDKTQLERVLYWREEVRDKLKQLTNREIEILELLKQGLDNKTIAENLNINVKTITYHITNLFRKLQVKNRQEAFVWATKYMSDNPDNSPS